MGQVRDLIGAQGAAAAGVLGPAEHTGLEEGAIDDQLTAALEQIKQAHLALGSVELVMLVHSHPRHPPAFGGQGVARPRQGLLLLEHLLARNLPVRWRHDRWRAHRGFPAVAVFLKSLGHVALVWLFIDCEAAWHEASIGVSYKCGAISRPCPTRLDVSA